MIRRIFLDTELIAPMWSSKSELMWIGLADEEGKSWYAISSEVDIDPANNEYVSGAFQLISPDEQRITRQEIAAAIVNFCGDVDEFWAWIPTIENFSKFSGLGEEAKKEYAKCWDTDFQMLRSLVKPWPDNWPNHLNDLNAASIEANVKVPPRAKNHLHPRIHAEWNRDLFKLIRISRES